MNTPATNPPAIFFDRDNTLIANDGYLGDPDGVRLISGAAEAVARARGMGFAVVTFSNQSGVARGMFSEEAVEAVNRRMDELLVAENPAAIIDRHEFCPFHPDGVLEHYRRESELRKPQPGMITRAARAMSLHLPGSWVVGDAARDIEAGHAAGCRTILVSDPSLPASPAAKHRGSVDPDETVASLAEAMDVIEAAGGAGSPDEPEPAEMAAEIDLSHHRLRLPLERGIAERAELDREGDLSRAERGDGGDSDGAEISGRLPMPDRGMREESVSTASSRMAMDDAQMHDSRGRAGSGEQGRAEAQRNSLMAVDTDEVESAREVVVARAELPVEVVMRENETSRDNETSRERESSPLIPPMPEPGRPMEGVIASGPQVQGQGLGAAGSRSGMSQDEAARNEMLRGKISQGDIDAAGGRDGASATDSAGEKLAAGSATGAIGEKGSPLVLESGSASTKLEAVCESILAELKKSREPSADFSVSKLMAGMTQTLAVAAFVWGCFMRADPGPVLPMLGAVFLQLLTISLLLMGRDK